MIKRRVDEKGVAGFFLDLPVLLIVILGLTLFIVTFTNLYFVYIDEVENQQKYKSAIDLHQDVQMYDKLLYEFEGGFEIGHFSIDRLENMDNETFEEDITTDTRYNYSVYIRNHERSEEWEFVNGEYDIPERRDLNYFTSAVTLIGEGEEDRYIGQLTVILWEV